MPQPTPLPVRPNGVPPLLRAMRRFVVWQYEWINGRWTKVPYVGNDPTRHASSTNPATWCSFDEACSTLAISWFSGIGIVLGRHGDGADRLTAVDLDHCIDDGIVAPWAQSIVDTVDSYTEQSPSGHGVRILLWADGLPTGGRKRGDIEMYNAARYVTLTGHHLGTRTDLQERTEAVAAVHADVFGTQVPLQEPSRLSDLQPAETLDDDYVIALASSARNGAKFDALWRGDTSGYSSHSEADLALCNMLAWWTNCDAAQIDRLFRRSGLMRDKWNRLGPATIAKAIANTTTGYTRRSETPVVAGYDQRILRRLGFFRL